MLRPSVSLLLASALTLLPLAGLRADGPDPAAEKARLLAEEPAAGPAVSTDPAALRAKLNDSAAADASAAAQAPAPEPEAAPARTHASPPSAEELRAKMAQAEAQVRQDSAGVNPDKAAVAAAARGAAQLADEVKAAPPPLPVAAAENGSAPADAPKAEPSLPKDEVVLPGPAKPEEKPSRFRLGNFVLGFLGGALLGSATGVLSSGGKSDSEKGAAAAVYGGAAGLAGGLLSMLLGATTPEEARPPQVQSALPAPGAVLALRF